MAHAAVEVFLLLSGSLSVGKIGHQPFLLIHLGFGLVNLATGEAVEGSVS